MRNVTFTLTLITGLAAQAQTSENSEVNSHLYVETTRETPLFLPATLKNNQRGLIRAAVLEPRALMAVSILDLEAWLRKPQNILYATNLTQTPMLSREGWICGVMVKESADPIDFGEACLSTTALHKTKAIEGNGEGVLQAFEALQKGDLTLLQALARYLERLEEPRILRARDER